MVSVPNVWGIDAAILRDAGLRRTPTCFVGFLGTYGEQDPFYSAAGTNLEIV